MRLEARATEPGLDAVCSQAVVPITVRHMRPGSSKSQDAFLHALAKAAGSNRANLGEPLVSTQGHKEPARSLVQLSQHLPPKSPSLAQA